MITENHPKHQFRMYLAKKYYFVFFCECGRRCIFNKTALRHLVSGR